MTQPQTTMNLAANQHSEIAATELVSFLGTMLDGIDLPSSDRNVLASSCLFASLDHHAGLVLLLGAGLFAPGFALIRSAYEGFVRGTWLGFCASDRQVSEFSRGMESPKIRHLINDIENSELFGGNAILSTAHQRNWSSFCGFSHNGVQQSLLAIKPTEISRTCSIEKLHEALSYVGSIATLSAITMCAIAERHDIANQILADAPRLIPGVLPPENQSS